MTIYRLVPNEFHPKEDYTCGACGILNPGLFNGWSSHKNEALSLTEEIIVNLEGYEPYYTRVKV